ncbi:hypothetical protein XPA_005976 [Xanthoria parietina]
MLLKAQSEFAENIPITIDLCLPAGWTASRSRSNLIHGSRSIQAFCCAINSVNLDVCLTRLASRHSFTWNAEWRLSTLPDLQRLASCPARALLPYFDPVLARVEFLHAGQ